MATVSEKTTLGRNFWLYHVGQMISTVGDACGNRPGKGGKTNPMRAIGK